MSNRITYKKNTIILASAICAAGFGLFGCGSDSNGGSGPNGQDDVCSISKDSKSM